MPQVNALVLNNGTADKTYSPSATKGVNHDQGFRDLSVPVAQCQPVITFAVTVSDTRRSVREKVTRPIIGTGVDGRSAKVGIVEVDIQLRADLVATEAEIKEALVTAMNSLSPTNANVAPVWFKGESFW